MEQSRVRPLWLLVLLLIPVLIFVPLLFRNNVSTASAIFDLDQKTLRDWLLYGALSGVQLVFSLGVIAFFAWVKRRVEMRFFVWLVIYLLATWLLYLGASFSFQLLAAKTTLVKGASFSAFILYWNTLQTVTLTTARFLLGALLASDLLFLLRQLGIEADNGVLRVLARARDHSVPLGLAMTLLLFSPFIVLIVLYFL